MYIDLSENHAKVLKVPSSEMDPVEIRLIRYIFIKGSVTAGF
jgi:hypothetical protein